MKKWILVLGILLVGCSPIVAETTPRLAEPAAAADLPDYGEAPELQTDVWLNSEQPLRLANLHGKVVLLEMWTFGCVNCQNVIPSLKDWHARYADEGLVVIANHYPEFSFEEDLDNLRQAVRENDIRYAVTQDNAGLNWRAYETRYWPTLFLIDKAGRIRYQHIGEGNYQRTDQAILALLAE